VPAGDPAAASQEVSAVSVSPINENRERVVADLELTLADEHGKLLAALQLITELRDALKTERVLRERLEQVNADQDDRLAAAQTQVRDLTRLRDNFHELYRAERDARLAAEALAEDSTRDRDQVQTEMLVLRAEGERLRYSLSRLQRVAPGTIETVGAVAPRTADDVEAILRRRLQD
jgi:hypothetical protein